MTLEQQVWVISIIVLLISILAAVLIWKYTGNVILALFFAPPVVWYILKKRAELDQESPDRGNIE